MKIGVIIPTYNEKDNIGILVEKIVSLGVRGLGVVVVDDNSPDGTGKMADRLARKYKGKVWVAHRSGKLGLGTAYVAGWQQAFGLGAQIVFSMDADLSHDPLAIPVMLEKLVGCDVVIGSRHMKGGQVIGFALWRQILTGAAQFFCKLVLGLPVHDSTSGFRGYRREVIEKIQAPSIRSSGYSFLIEVLYRVHKHGFKIAETPIVFGLRNSGESKVSKEEIYKALKTVFRLRFLG